MSRLLDMKEFGEAAPFLRKSDIELLAAQTVAFDGIVDRFDVVLFLWCDLGNSSFTTLDCHDIMKGMDYDPLLREM